MKPIRVLIGAIVIVAAFALLIRADRKARVQRQVASSATATIGAGHWLADTGDAIRFRHDGTGTSIHTFNGNLHHCDFDWSCDGSMLTIKNFPNVLGSFMAHETGLKTATFPVDEITDETFVFRHNGVIITLTPDNGIERSTPMIQNNGSPGTTSSD